MTQDEIAIRALVAEWARALERKDAHAMTQHYAADAIMFDATPPAVTRGRDAIRARWQATLPYFADRMRSEHRDLNISVGADLAIVHGLHHVVPEPADHPCGKTWMRVTICFQKRNGEWLVTHEHVSLPFDPMTQKAAAIT